MRVRFGKTRGTPEHYFRVQVSRDGGQNFMDALVMKRDDRDGPDRSDTPYGVEWAATTELEHTVEAALGRLAKRYSAKHTKNELRKILKDVPSHFFTADAEVPLDLSVSIANSRFRFETRFILDAKWKRLEPGAPNHGVSQADAYQLFAYGRTYGCRRVVLVYPRTAEFRETNTFRFVGDRELSLSCFPFDVADAAGSVLEIVQELADGGGRITVGTSPQA